MALYDLLPGVLYPFACLSTRHNASWTARVWTVRMLKVMTPFCELFEIPSGADWVGLWGRKGIGTLFRGQLQPKMVFKK